MADVPRIDRARSFSLPLAPLSERVARRLSEMRLFLHPIVSAQRVWDQVLDQQEREMLGSDLVAAYERFSGTIGIWLALHHVWWPRAVIQLARGIGLLCEADYRWLNREISTADPTLTESYRAAPKPNNSDEDLEDAIEQARQEFRLLLVQGNGHYRLYWDRQWRRQNWSAIPKLWELLWSLAAQAKIGRPTAWDNLGGRNQRAIVDRRSRLKRFIPEKMDELIIAKGGGSYQLDLPSTEILLIDLDAGQWLLEPDLDRGSAATVGPHLIRRDKQTPPGDL